LANIRLELKDNAKGKERLIDINRLLLINRCITNFRLGSGVRAERYEQRWYEYDLF